ncbi:SH3 domain-containing protein [Cavenderia fasciculata]|uniref:Peroxisomal membrane protein PEX13 n=1 Tax=Cavenderia fasciculata TaxID=261658 RepID=F4PVE6_CACFS|nr:SH3 domain-containing protein [Cavenderia fasciculata]EGG19960.1 SH3 domain-containing protein [Cavenderia fasciculata]|eukprot:XP_004366943.1 SH3 domain-containing protein [Cavenderia fasciculata]
MLATQTEEVEMRETTATTTATIATIPSSHVCPHCDHIYYIDTLNYTNHMISTCSHMLCKTTIVSKVNSPFKSVNDYSVDLHGSQVPLVIFLRFIKYLRERNSSGHNPQQGYYTIHQSKTRISNSFQGVTVFRLEQSNLNNVDQTNDTITQHTFYLTSNPINDLSFFESFIIKYYVDILCPITLNIHHNHGDNNNKLNGNINVDNNSNNNIIINRVGKTSNNNNQLMEQQVYAILSNQQLWTIFNDENQDDEQWDDSHEDDGGGGGSNGRWSIILTGIPNQLPIFVWLTPNMINHHQQQQQEKEENNNYLIPLVLSNNNNSNSNNSNNITSVKLLPIIHLPSVAIQKQDMRPSPPKPWERAGSPSTAAPPASVSTAAPRPPLRSGSPNNGTSTSIIGSSTANGINSSSHIGGGGGTSSSTIMTRPRTPQRPWDGGGYSSSSDYMTGRYGGSSYGSGGGSGYGSSYDSTGYGAGSGYGGTNSSSYGSYGGYGGMSSYGGSGSGYGSSYGNSGYGGMSSYGGGYGGMSSYGSGYSGMSSYGSGGGYGMGMGYGAGGGYRDMDGKGPLGNVMSSGHTWMEALHSIVDTFSRFTFLLNSNFDAVRVSFASVMRLCHSMSQFNHEIFRLVKTFTLFRLFQSVASKFIRIFRYILGKPIVEVKENVGLDLNDFQKFNGEKGKQGPQSIKTFIVIIAVTFIGIPMIIGQLISLSRGRRRDASLDRSWENDMDKITKVRAIYDFDSETPRDLPIRVGDVINVIGKPHEEWWQGELNNRVGLFPVNFVEPIQDDLEQPQQPSQQQQQQQQNNNNRQQRLHSPPKLTYNNNQNQNQNNSFQQNNNNFSTSSISKNIHFSNSNNNPSFHQDGADTIQSGQDF